MKAKTIEKFIDVLKDILLIILGILYGIGEFFTNLFRGFFWKEKK